MPPKKDNQEHKKPITNLKKVYIIYKDSQKFRIRTSNRIKKSKINPDGVSDELLKELEEFDPEAELQEITAHKIQVLKENLPEEIIKADVEQVLTAFIDNFFIDKYNIENQHFVSDEFNQTGAELILKYKKIEKQMEINIKSQIVRYPIHKWLLKQHGIGPILAGGLIAYLHPISRFPTVQKLWRYAGVGTMDICQKCGKEYRQPNKYGDHVLKWADRIEETSQRNKDKSKVKSREKCIEEAKGFFCSCMEPEIVTGVRQQPMSGRPLDWNPELKSLLYNIGDQFIRHKNGPYRKLYDQFYLDYSSNPKYRAEMESRKGKKGDIEVKGTGHINEMARRKTVKIFLSHLFQVWNELEGRKPPEPYSFAILGHSGKIEPFESE